MYKFKKMVARGGRRNDGSYKEGCQQVQAECL